MAMKVQVLVATMNQTDYSLLEKMNIQTDAIIGNQCDRNEITEFEYQNRMVKWFSFNERGVGLNRNNTLMRATEDIVLFADDDVVYTDGYEDTIIKFYKSHPDADVVIFNLKMKRGENSFFERVTKEGRVSRLSAIKYGTYCISARRDKLRFANVYFHMDFGGGTKYCSGEDSVFLQDCYRKRLKVYATKALIGVLDHGESTWFKGYNEKYFFDKGVLFATLFPAECYGYALIHCIKKRNKYKTYGWKKGYWQMLKGIRHRKRDL
jgi:glycosyltransferase involved in cell wall biosynthesis